MQEREIRREGREEGRRERRERYGYTRINNTDDAPSFFRIDKITRQCYYHHWTYTRYS
jgi:hypothetical protein